MGLFDFSGREAKILEKIKEIEREIEETKRKKDYDTAKDEQKEIDALNFALNLYEKFISLVYPEILSDSLKMRSVEIAKKKENKNNLDNMDDICLDIKVPITLGRQYYSIFYRGLNLGIDLSSVNCEAVSKFIDLLYRFAARNKFYMASIFDEQTQETYKQLHIQGTYKQLKDIYYGEMQGLEYMRQNFDEGYGNRLKILH